MAAAAKALSPADGRHPCPLCGGLIHPIAGRCKHCKGDISATRTTRPAAAAALPSLQASGPAQPYAGRANAAYAAAAGKVPHAHHPANAHMAVPIAMKTAMLDESQPILPPRPTGTMSSAPARPANWKSWPVVVIGLAVLAIIVAVILMVWPANQTTRADAKTLAPPPAPERMDTNPSPSTGNGPSSSTDPWRTPSPAAPDPAPAQPSQPSVPDIDQIDPPNLSDPFRGGGQNDQLGLMNQILKHSCDRLSACPSGVDSTVKMMCDATQLALPKATAPTCQAAQRCLAKIDQLPCDDIDPADGLGMIQGFQDCVEAMTRC